MTTLIGQWTSPARNISMVAIGTVANVLGRSALILLVEQGTMGDEGRIRVLSAKDLAVHRRFLRHSVAPVGTRATTSPREPEHESPRDPAAMDGSRGVRQVGSLGQGTRLNAWDAVPLQAYCAS